MCEGVEVQLHLVMCVMFRALPFDSRANNARHTLDRRLCGPQSRFGDKKVKFAIVNNSEILNISDKVDCGLSGLSYNVFC
jgi:hypothetical protein